MPNSTADLRSLSLAIVAHRCRCESEHFFHRRPHDPAFCYELFRRAIVERHEGAWTLIYRQYRPLLHNWVERHANFAGSGEESTFFVNRAFEKLWSAVNAEKFAHFPDLAALLRYLQLCVHSVIIDHARAAANSASPLSLSDVVGASEMDGYSQDGDNQAGRMQRGADVSGSFIEIEERRELWQRIQARLNDEREVRLLYYRYELDLKPRQICERFADDFAEIQEVYTLMQNIIARLRRDADLRDFFENEFAR